MAKDGYQTIKVYVELELRVRESCLGPDYLLENVPTWLSCVLDHDYSDNGDDDYYYVDATVWLGVGEMAADIAMRDRYEENQDDD